MKPCEASRLGTRRHARHAVGLVGLLAALLAVGVGVTAQSGGRTPPASADERLKALQEEADRLASQSRSVLTELRELETARRDQAAHLRDVEGELAEVRTALRASEERVASLERQRVAGTPGVENRLVAIYKRGRGGYARLLFETDDARELARLGRGIAAIARLDRVRVDAHRRAVAAERAAVVELERRRAEVATIQASAIEARAALDRAVGARNRLVDDLDRRRDLAARYIGELQASRREIEKTVTTLARERTPGPSLSAARGTLEWPVRGPLLSRFGRGAATRGGAAVMRNGIEVETVNGTTARAVYDGTVGFAGPFAGFGTLVIVDHGGGAYSLYGHLVSAKVAQGARVKAGEILGETGNTPRGVPAAYFELRIDGRPVDPLQWLRSTP